MIHCAPLKRVSSNLCTARYAAGTLEISRPNIRAARQIATAATAFRWVGEGATVDSGSKGKRRPHAAGRAAYASPREEGKAFIFGTRHP